MRTKRISAKNLPFIKVSFYLYLAAIALSVLGTLVSYLFDRAGYNYLVLPLQFLAPYFILLIGVAIYFVKSGFSQFLKLSRENYKIYLITLLISFLLALLLYVVPRFNLYLLTILVNALTAWILVMFAIVFFSGIYTLATWLLLASPKETKWQFLLKTFASLFIVPLLGGIFMDFLLVPVSSVYMALNKTYTMISSFKLIGILYGFFILIYYIVYKKELTKNVTYAAVTYLLIILFIYFWIPKFF